MRDRRHVPVLGFALRRRSFENADHRPRDVMDVHERQLATSIVNVERKSLGDIVSEGGNDRVVVGPASGPEHIWKSKNDCSSSILCKTLHRHFCVPLTEAVGILE